MRYVSRLVRVLAATVAIAAGGLSAPSIAVAGEVPIAPQITVSPSTVETGATFTVEGVGWTQCADIAVVIENGSATEPIATVLAAEVVDGGWSLPGTAPNVAGTYTVRASYVIECQGVATDELTVVAAATTTTSTTTTTTTTTTTLAPTTVAPTTVAPTSTQQIVPPVSTLPGTGSAESRTAIMAGVLLTMGAALLWTARRRPRSA